MASDRAASQSVFKPWMGVAATLLCVVVATVYFLSVATDTEDVVESSDDHAKSVTESSDDEHSHGSSVADSATARFPERNLRYAWQKTPDTKIDELERPADLPDESVHVTLPGDYERWLLGTPVELEIPQANKKFRTVVDRIVPDDFGNTSIYAKPDADEAEFQRLIVTFNSTHTFAYVSTAQGSYELSGTNRGGWLIPTRSLDKRRDFSLKDTGETLRFRHTNTKHVPPRDE